MMAHDSEHVEIEGEMRGNGTALAILFYVESAEEVWFPRGQVEVSDDKQTLLVPRWLAEKKGLV